MLSDVPLGILRDCFGLAHDERFALPMTCGDRNTRLCDDNERIKSLIIVLCRQLAHGQSLCRGDSSEERRQRMTDKREHDGH